MEPARGKITISAWLNDNTLCLRVTDNGVGFEPNRPPRNGNAGVGLSNLRERLRAFYGDAAAFHIHSSVDGGGTVAEVSLPRAIRADSDRAEHGVIWRTFFSSVGSIASVVAFAIALEAFKLSGAWSLLIGEAVEVIYLLAASAMEETKTFDVAMVMFFFAGQVALLAGSIDSFLTRSTTLLCASCAAVAIVPQIVGAEPFTAYWMRRAYPLWLQRGESFARISGLIAMLWAVVFAVLAVASIRSSGLHAMSPAYIAIVGLLVGPLSCACPTWLIHRAGLSRASAEFFILGLPFMLKRDVDPELNLSVHFVVSGAEPGSYYVEISRGRCTGGQGDLKHPGLTIYCSTDSWNLVARGALSRGTCGSARTSAHRRQCRRLYAVLPMFRACPACTVSRAVTRRRTARISYFARVQVSRCQACCRCWTESHHRIVLRLLLLTQSHRYDARESKTIRRPPVEQCSAPRATLRFSLSHWVQSLS